MSHTREIAQSVEAHRYVFYSDKIEIQDEWSNVHFTKHPQQGKDLGQRMEQAFSTVLEKYDKAIIIGSDCPMLTTEIVNDAFQKLDDFPFVIGPAMDGGYYLLGMNRFSPQLFENIAWSTAQVFKETTKRITALGQTYAVLDPLYDIDNEEDWEKYGFHQKERT